MKRVVVFVLLMCASVVGQSWQITLRQCSICESEWEQFSSPRVTPVLHGFFNSGLQLNTSGGEEFSFDTFKSDVWMCDDCYKIYREIWADEIFNLYHRLLQKAREEQVEKRQKNVVKLKEDKIVEILSKIDRLKEQLKQVKDGK